MTLKKTRKSGQQVEIPRLSIIMPVFNEHEHIAFALESILMQDVDFLYEIIVVDDASTDGTAAIVASYQKAFPHVIRYHENPENKGNAYSFWQGLTLSRGEFFQVLDGDDFLIRRDKLQRQVDFLSANPEYTAVAANSLRLFSDGRFCTETRAGRGECDFTYTDVLRFSFYFHTSSYMYRNVYRGNVPAFLQNDWARGDNMRTLLHARHGKVKYLDFIGSVYRFNNRGIWSSLTPTQRNQRVISVLNTIRNEVMETEEEKNILAQTIRFYESYRSKKPNNAKPKLLVLLSMLCTPRHLMYKLLQRDSYAKLWRFLFPGQFRALGPQMHAPEALLKRLHTYLARMSYSSETRTRIFAACYTATGAEQMCEAVGRMYLDASGYRWHGVEYDDNRVVLFVSGLSRTSGGVFREVMSVMDIHLSLGNAVTILSSERVATLDDIIEELTAGKRVSFERVPSATMPMYEKMKWLIGRLVALRPGKLYPFPSHDDVAMVAAVQTGLARQVVLDFSFDHGISLLLTHSAVNVVIVKLPYHYYMLRNALPAHRLAYIPVFMPDDAIGTGAYKPLSNRKLVTMTAAARSYKVDEYVYPYTGVVAMALAQTGGRHIHVGPLTPMQKQSVAAALKRHGVPSGRFIHIPWAESLSQMVREKGVDAYIQSFPVGAARTTIEVMRAGIPVINHLHGTQPMFCASEFSHPLAPEWEKPEDLLRILAGLDAKELHRLSADARAYFEEYNALAQTAPRVAALQGLPPPPHKQRYGDAPLRDIAQDFPHKKISFNPHHLGYVARIAFRQVLLSMGLLEAAKRLRACL